MREILQSKYFSCFRVIAGSKGLNREAQAVVLFDAPDGYKWFKGKEFVLSSGYLFSDNIGLFKEVILHLHNNSCAAMGIKTQRYLHEIPQEIVQLCNELGLPLINVPYDLPWIDIINAVNSIAINRFITRVNDSSLRGSFSSQPNSINNKIKKIAINLSKEIESAVSVVDLLENKIFTYPNSYKVREDRVIFEPHYDPDFSYQKEVLCDKLNIFRITDLAGEKSCPWIVVPIILKDILVSKLIIWEECKPIDYYDLFAIRVCYTLLSGVYEQFHSLNSFERRFYDDFLQSLVSGELDTKQKVIKAMMNFQHIQLNLDSRYLAICIKKEDSVVSFHENRENIYKAALLDLKHYNCIFGILDDSTLVLLYDIGKFNNDVINAVKSNFDTLLKSLEIVLPSSNFRMGIGDPVSNICEIKRSYIEALKAIEIGHYIYPNDKIVAFEDLGPFGLLRFENIQRKSFGSNFNTIYPLLKEENSQELITTLKVYLESSSNYNIASQKLYLHSNTIRYRIAKIQQICNIDLDDPMERLKTEITLKFIDMLR